jgi:N-acetylmuramoyl-L-alanine amidase
MYCNYSKLGRFFWAFSLLLISILLFPSHSDAYSNAKKTIEPGLSAEIDGGKKIFLTACGEYGIEEWASRVLASPEKKDKFLSGKCLKVPLGELSEEYQLEVMKTLFAKDSYDESGWIHKVTYISQRRGGGETMWNISGWFTGNPQNYKKILKYNGMSKRTKLFKGTRIQIPLELLRPAFKEPILFEIAARRTAEGPSADAKKLNGDLTLKSDSHGPYASYRMKKGDTIYSKVVMKYTGRVTKKDVMDAVKTICRRSSIRNAKRLKPGDEVKIPLDLLSLQYLPPGDPRRQEYEGMKRDAMKYSNPVHTAKLKGIAVILDSGHGGDDPGAIGNNRVYEDEVVYDILCRIKRRLETTTMAKVIPTVIDKSQQYEPRSSSVFSKDKDEYLLTNPHYKNGSAKVAVNLRWYLVNSIFRKLKGNGTKPNEVVFVSLHADSLHSKARGSMVYIPGAYYCRGNGGKRGKVYDAHAEVREKQFVKLSYEDRVKSEGLSGELAKSIIKSLRKYDIRIHAEKPIRNHVVRGRRSYVPAVIRHNIVPTKILVEVANLRNYGDNRLLADHEFREEFAAAFVDALTQHYGGK